MTFADLVLTGAPVYTVDAAKPWSDAVAIAGDRIVGLGAEQVAELTGPRTQRLDLPGALIVPGFQDAHVHAPPAGRNRRNVDLSDLSGRPAYLAYLAAYATAHPDDAWLMGGGWAMEHFPHGLPDKADLDAIVPDRPVFLYNRDVHGAWVNSAALRLAGIDAGTPDPADGRFERDPAGGEPTGMLHEGAAYSFEERWVPQPDRAGWEAATLTGQEYLHSVGITGWQDAWVTPETQAAYLSLAADGRLTARVSAALWWDRHRGLDQIADLQTRREQVRAAGHVTFRAETVKIMVDGTPENMTAALLEPYCDGCGGHADTSGLTYVDADVLAAAVTALDALDFQVHMHAIGDRAVRIALDAVQAARAANGVRDNRHHIAHLQVVQPADIPRFAELDVIANCQAYWAHHEPQMDELTIPFLGPERDRLQYPFGALAASGARLAMGSDWAVTTADPLPQIEVAVTRINPEQRGNAPFIGEQRLSLDTAVAAFTAGSAYVNHDADSGRIALGQRADLAVLDGNILAPGQGLPADHRVTHTIAAGRLVHQP